MYQPTDRPISDSHPVAYLCAEYAVDSTLRIYSGGLGVLAGDHLKSASDIDLPLIAVGLFYRGGYLRQEVTDQGEQIAHEIANRPLEQPVDPVTDEHGKPIEISIDLPGRELRLRAWRVAVGRVDLYLLDADAPGNSEADRAITRVLYGGDEEMRIQQELVLGCGGVRLLQQLGIEPSVWHLNEGHAAFSTLERVAALCEGGMGHAEAAEVVRANTAFTTHTPVPAGHDKFGEDLAAEYLGQFTSRTGLSLEQVLDAGRSPDEPDVFNMTCLALTYSSFCNAVSVLHGAASRRLLAPFWPDTPEDEIPITSITNGIHLPTWTHPSLAQALGAAGRPVRGEDFARRAGALTDEELWQIRRALRARLIGRMIHDIEHSEPDGAVRDAMLAGLDDHALLIGFARRFARYKRADLLVADAERMAAILGDPERPVRILIAGKAHPRDERGQGILKQVVASSRTEPLLGKIYFLQDYGTRLASFLVQGVDVWLNTPKRMQEASGTSGMKAAANGGLNLSISDGWWPEAADGRNGWTIAEQPLEDGGDQNLADSQDLYRLLEEVVAPLFFRRNRDGIPADWLGMVRHALETIPPVFNTDRMVSEYRDRAYHPRAESAQPVAPEPGA